MKRTLNIVSGKESQCFWDDINKLNALSTGEDIRYVFYHMGCKMQELETEIEKLIDISKRK